MSKEKSETKEIVKKSHNLMVRDRYRRKVRAEKQQVRRDKDWINEILERRALRNLEIYKKWDLAQKIKFARHGYVFANNPEWPAIRIGTTCIATEPGRDRGIFVGNGLPYLPEGFVILFNWSAITNDIQSGVQSHYQLKLSDNLYLQMLPEPSQKHPEGLANFINAAVASRSMQDPKYKSALRLPTKQNMRNSQCIFVINYNYGGLINTIKQPAYVKVQDKVIIPRGNELLLPVNYNGMTF